jgi:hypothetical protein
MARCRNCDSHVTDRFARVFGDNQDDVHNCLACTTNRDLYDGAASAGDDWSDSVTSAWSQ